MPSKTNITERWQDQVVIKKDGKWSVNGRPRSIVVPSYHETPSNIPGFALVGLLVTLPPSAATPPHNHNGSAVTVTVIKGSVNSQTVCPGEDPEGQGSGVLRYSVGESWYEPPGCHHVRNENASDTEEAVLIGTFVQSTKEIEEKGLVGALVVVDADVEEKKKSTAT